MTKAQKWARERNKAKFLLEGIKANMKGILAQNKILRPQEKTDIMNAYYTLRDMTDRWKSNNKNSKEKYLRDEK